jgi:hypothetical protein
MATVCAQQITHPSPKARIIKVKAAHVLGVLVFNDQKASIRLTLRDLYFYKRADFSRWGCLFTSPSIHSQGGGQLGRPRYVMRGWARKSMHEAYHVEMIKDSNIRL